MTLVPPEQHIYYVIAAYAVTFAGLALLAALSWAAGRRWTKRAEAARSERL